MTVLTFPLPTQLLGDNLVAELSLAGVSAQVTAYEDHLEINVPDGTNEQTVASVLAAHTGIPTQAQLDTAQASRVNMTTEEYAAVRAQMQTLRDLRQMGRNAFMALTATERDRLMYDAFTATTQVFLSLLRDQ